VLPDLQEELFRYDDLGNLTNHVDFNLKATTYFYDEDGRLTNKTPDVSFDVDPIVFTYLPSGQRAAMKYPKGVGAGSEEVKYEYLDSGRIWRKTSPQGTISYEYDLNGNVTRLATSHGTIVQYGWDTLNRLSSVTNSSTSPVQTTDYHYDDAGNLKDLSQPNGILTTYRYNTLNRLTDLTVVKTSVGGNQPRATFDYNPADRPLSLSGMRRAARETVSGTSRSVNYDYDALYRLTLEDIISGAPVGSIRYDATSGYSGYD
jgi:YD repeat-containing protein